MALKTDNVVRNPSFRWLWAAQGVSVTGAQFTELAIPVLAVTFLQATEWEMGLLNAASTAAFLLVGLPAGAWIDRWLKRKVMIWADLMRFVLLAVIPILWFAGQLEMWHLVAVSLLFGLASVFFDVSYQSYIPVLLPKKQIGPANSVLESTSQIANIAGPGFVGVLLTFIKAPVLIIVDAFSYLTSAIFLTRVKDQEVRKPVSERQHLVIEIRDGLKFVWNQPLIRRIAFTTASSNFASTLIFTLLPLVILRDLAISPAGFGITMSLAAIGGLLGAMATPLLSKKIGEGTLIPVSAILCGLATLLIPVAASQESQLLALVILGAAQFTTSFTVLTYNISQVTLRQKLCPHDLLGRMNASIRFFVWGVMPISALLSGFLGLQIGLIPTLWIGAGLTLIAAAFVTFSPLLRMKVLPDGEKEAT